MRVEWLACAALLAGCDVLWSIDRVTPIAADGPMLVSCDGGGHNEDGDAYPDDCDVCPGVADDQKDDDEDGVGNACDPSGTETNKLVFFEPFASDTGKWNALNGSWLVRNDKLEYTTVLADNAYVLFNGVVPVPPYVIDYHYTVDQIDPAMASLFMVTIDTTGPSTGGSLGQFRTVGPLKDSIQISFAEPMTGMASDIMTVTAGGYHVHVNYDPGGTVSCRLDADDNTIGGATMLQLSSKPPSGTIGFRSLQVGARVDYIAIYKKS
ncbi:MAG TPA: hypothetical protein VFV99_21105 [Kofleriaceae bacterium]|nr:hypothetical protein [Kofleriaceae bacterium]